MRQILWRRMAILFTCIGLIACEQEQQTVVPERIRAIKPFTVTELAGGNIRVFPGKITAADKSTLSFPAAGSIASVEVNQGDQVKSGQVLATLDPKPFLLDVEAAQSQLKSALAVQEEKALELDRQRILYEKKIVAKAALDKAAAAAATTNGDVEVAQARLAQLQRDLEKTKLRSPFDGSVALRDVEPFAEVSAGQTLFEINADGSYEFEFSIPDQDVRRVTVGQAISVEVSAQENCGCTARIKEIGTQANTANAVKVVATLSDNPPDLLPGTSASAEVLFSSRGTTNGYLVPIVAVAAADDGAGEGAFVFKYSNETGTVTRVPIKAGEGRDNLIEVTQGVELGDIIAAAGVSFLRDGQKVKLLAETDR